MLKFMLTSILISTVVHSCTMLSWFCNTIDLKPSGVIQHFENRAIAVLLSFHNATLPSQCGTISTALKMSISSWSWNFGFHGQYRVRGTAIANLYDQRTKLRRRHSDCRCEDWITYLWAHSIKQRRTVVLWVAEHMVRGPFLRVPNRFVLIRPLYFVLQNSIMHAFACNTVKALLSPCLY